VAEPRDDQTAEFFLTADYAEHADAGENPTIRVLRVIGGWLPLGSFVCGWATRWPNRGVFFNRGLRGTRGCRRESDHPRTPRDPRLIALVFSSVAEPRDDQTTEFFLTADYAEHADDGRESDHPRTPRDPRLNALGILRAIRG